MRPFDDISRLESAEILDRPAAAVRGVVQRVLANRRIKDALHGVWLGHPLHPGVAQFAVGSFVSASLVDLSSVFRWRGGSGQAESSGLILVGLGMTVPTVASGWADWSDSHQDQQRVGLIHATVNATAVLLYGAALLARCRGGTGRGLSAAGGAVIAVGALLGGHLGYRQALGANHAEDVAHLGPRDWQALGALVDLPDGQPSRRIAGEVPVLVVRRGASVSVLSDNCPHLSAPLSDGEVVGDGRQARVVCPWHGSEFRLDDGCVVHGPATAPVPRFEARITDGTVQVRVVTIPGVSAG